MFRELLSIVVSLEVCEDELLLGAGQLTSCPGGLKSDLELPQLDNFITVSINSREEPLGGYVGVNRLGVLVVLL